VETILYVAESDELRKRRTLSVRKKGYLNKGTNNKKNKESSSGAIIWCIINVYSATAYS
jgi:hypothetical protein